MRGTSHFSDDLRLCNLLFGHLGVASKLANFDTEDLESSCEVSNHLLDKSLHRSDVDNLESIQVECSGLLFTVLGKFIENHQNGDVCL